MRYQAALRTDIAAYHNAFRCDCNAPNRLLTLTALFLGSSEKNLHYRSNKSATLVFNLPIWTSSLAGGTRNFDLRANRKLMWILFTLLAAFMQAWRNAFQKQLSIDVNVLGTTLARFIYASPLAAGYLWVLYGEPSAPLPQLNAVFSCYVIGAALMQILATALMVVLFKQQNYAIGVGLAKSEAIFAAVLGVLFFASPLTALGWLGVFVGSIAVFLLSGLRSFSSLSWSTVLIGAASGLAFALTSLWVREASLALGLPFPYGAAWVLLFVISLQTLLLLGYLALRDRATLVALWQRPRLTLLTSITSCIGSLGWFTAMSLETVPLVKTLGQVEVLFTLFISAFFFKEKLKKYDYLGLGLIVLAALLVMWA